MRNIISINDIINCNAILKEKNLRYKIHLRDACGKQSCWIEAVGENVKSAEDTELIAVLNAYFAGIGFTLEFGECSKDFWLNQK